MIGEYINQRNFDAFSKLVGQPNATWYCLLRYFKNFFSHEELDNDEIVDIVYKNIFLRIIVAANLFPDEELYVNYDPENQYEIYNYLQDCFGMLESISTPEHLKEVSKEILCHKAFWLLRAMVRTRAYDPRQTV